VRLILLGPPGSGKGTQAKFIAERFTIPHISTGEILREAMRTGTQAGRKAARYVEKGQLVPDEVVIAIVEDRFQEADCQNGFLLDGFPRTIAQADALQERLTRLGWSLDRVLNFEVAEEEIVRRLSGRRVCQSCGRNYHIESMPPSCEGVCDVCGGEIVQRKD